MKDFYDLADFQKEQIDELLSLTTRLCDKPEPQALAGKVLALLFLSPSLRTLASFQAAMARLGGGTFVISPEMSIHGLETQAGIVMDGLAAEHIREAVPVIASYGDALGVRLFAERRKLEDDLADHKYNEMRELCSVPLINMESAISHPCQSLADWKTMNDIKLPCQGGKFVLSWVFHPKPQPLALPASTLVMAAMRGMQVTVLRPEGFELPGAIMEKARLAASIAGGSVSETSDRTEALQGAHILYVKSWCSTRHYGDSGKDEDLRLNSKDWCVEDSWFDPTHTACRLMHCLPVRRGVEVLDNVLDSPRSVVIQQARNRMLTQMALLHHMLGPGY
jgi:N-acetylornithine carbamoyltransferase